MAKMKFFLFGVFLLILSSFVFAEVQTPTYQFAKIYLNPFYRASMTANTNYTYTLTVNPPDRVSSVVNAIISFNGQINGQTQTFTLWVNGQSCNTPTYSVATAYSTTGNVQFSFDCSNRITKAGTYTMEFRSAVNTGAMNGWLDLTYMNEPKGIINLYGTEYRTNEMATIWLQLKDNQGLPEDDGSCWLDIYAPLSVNSSHPEVVKYAPMIHLNGSEGIYYYDILTPNKTGVYMNIASCSYTTSGAFVYDLGGAETNYPTRTATSGTFVGSPIFLNDYEDWIYTQCDSTGGGTKYCTAYYDFDTKIHFQSVANVTNINLYYMGEASVTATSSWDYWRWDTSTWVALPNTLTYAGVSSQPLGIGNFMSNNVPLTGAISGTGIIRIRQTTAFGSNFKVFDNWLNLQLVTAYGIVQDLKGSSEMHVNSWFDTIEQAQANINATTPANVWSYINRTLTYYPPELDMTNYTKIDNSIGQARQNVTGEVALVPNRVWNNTERTLTYYEDKTNYTKVGDSVWNWQGVLTDNILSQIATKIWNYVARYTHGEVV